MGEHALYRFDLKAYNLFNLSAVERRKHDNLVDTVEELGADSLLEHIEHLGLCFLHHFSLVLRSEGGEILAYHIRTHIRCHDDYGVLEVYVSTLVVGQTAVVEHLKQDIEYIGVSFLDFIEKHYRVGFAPYCFGELSALVVANISGRRSDESRH